MTSQYSTEHNRRATDEHEGILEQIADLVVLHRYSPTYGSRKRISHIITPLTVRNDDVGHRLPGIARPFQAQVAALIATQDYPFPVTGECASDDNNQNSGSRFVANDDRSTL